MFECGLTVFFTRELIVSTVAALLVSAAIEYPFLSAKIIYGNIARAPENY